jgi:hypothetical protein
VYRTPQTNKRGVRIHSNILAVQNISRVALLIPIITHMMKQKLKVKSQSPAVEFLKKIYETADDSVTDDVICWGGNGNSFVVIQHAEFATDLISKHFKHHCK